MTNFDETKITGLIDDNSPEVSVEIEEDPSKLHVEIEETSLQIQVGIQSSGPQGPPGPMGTTNYNLLENRPSIQSIELIGNKTFEELGITPISQEEIVNIL